MRAEEIAALRGLYGSSSAARITELVGAADALVGALQTLRTCPTPDGAERIAIQLSGMHTLARATVDALAREVRE